MKHIFQKLNRLSFISAIIIFSLLFMVISSCQKETTQTSEEAQVAKAAKLAKDFTQVNLGGDNNDFSPARVDPNLVNGWGIAFSSGGTAWVSAEGTGLSLVLNKDGGQVRAPVSIPSPGSSSGGHPSGQVFNSTPNFGLPNGSRALFIFAGLDGVISAWNGAAGNSAIEVIDDSPDAVYSGIAIALDNGTPFLYAANFSEHKIDVYDTDFVEVDKPFTDPGIPDEFSPFNIQNVGGKLYVMYAKESETEEGEEETGPGLGYVDIFNPNGSLVKRFVSKGQLNAPWGVAWAPASFFGDDGQPAILIGNFGDGHINAYNESGEFLGQLRSHGQPLEIEGLWGISFAPSTATSINPNWLYFAAGPGDEEHGLFGYITK
jgi:uncharacterized protein (TIGR03118 family)